MTDIKTIVSKMNAKALGGAKIPHAVSNPVLREENGKPYIVSFVYTFSRDNLKNNRMPRPIAWIQADIETGEVLKEYSCKEKDFSDAAYDTTYDLNDPDVVRPTREDFSEIYGLMDSVRSEYLTSGQISAGRYTQYLDRILEVTPAGYRRFYRELSSISGI